MVDQPYLGFRADVGTVKAHSALVLANQSLESSTQSPSSSKERRQVIPKGAKSWLIHLIFKNLRERVGFGMGSSPHYMEPLPPLTILAAIAGLTRYTISAGVIESSIQKDGRLEFT
jgi:hypothetical protein